jgi:hypothetical protein
MSQGCVLHHRFVGLPIQAADTLRAGDDAWDIRELEGGIDVLVLQCLPVPSLQGEQVPLCSRRRHSFLL